MIKNLHSIGYIPDQIKQVSIGWVRHSFGVEKTLLYKNGKLYYKDSWDGAPKWKLFPVKDFVYWEKRDPGIGLDAFQPEMVIVE